MSNEDFNRLCIPRLPTTNMYQNDVMVLEWQDFFLSLFNRVGGDEEFTNSGLLALIEQVLASQKGGNSGKISELERRTRELEDNLRMKTSTQDIERRIRELEDNQRSKQNINELERRISDLEGSARG